MEVIWTNGRSLGDHCHNDPHRAACCQTGGPANASLRRSGGTLQGKSENGSSVKDWFSSFPRNDDDGEGRKSDHNRDSDDGDGDPSGAVGKVTSHVVGDGGPSSFVISVCTASLTMVETLSLVSTETS